MTLIEAQTKLVLKRKKLKRLLAEMTDLRNIIISYGLHTDERRNGIKKRNKAMYAPYKKGNHVKEIAEKFDNVISAERVRQVCIRLEKIEARRLEVKKR